MKLSRYIVQRINRFTQEVIESCCDDEIFDSYEDAQEYATECTGTFGVGAELADDMGQMYDDPDDFDFIVTEIERSL